MLVRGRRVLVPLLAVLVSDVGVLLRLVVLVEIVEMRRLEMVMGRRVVMGGRLMVMLAR
jgi:hypothetical protein